MEATLRDLGALLVKAIPTVFLLLVVYVYLRWMFFKPLEKVLAERQAATQGTRQKAEALLAKASQTAANVEAQLRKARDEIYQQQEEERRRWIAEQTAQLDQARQSAREQIQQARHATGKRRRDRQAQPRGNSRVSGRSDRLAIARKEDRLMRRATLALVLGLSLAPCALPLETGAGSESSAEAGDPWIVWKWINFAILAAGLGYLISQERSGLLSRPHGRDSQVA